MHVNIMWSQLCLVGVARKAGKCSKFPLWVAMMQNSQCCPGAAMIRL